MKEKKDGSSFFNYGKLNHNTLYIARYEGLILGLYRDAGSSKGYSMCRLDKKALPVSDKPGTIKAELSDTRIFRL